MPVFSYTAAIDWLAEYPYEVKVPGQTYLAEFPPVQLLAVLSQKSVYEISAKILHERRKRGHTVGEFEYASTEDGGVFAWDHGRPSILPLVKTPMPPKRKSYRLNAKALKRNGRRGG
jgi:hypothetical protein